jgi:predicted small lipoprotein YifL
MEPSGLHRLLVALLIAAATAAGLAACAEKQPRTLPKGEGAAYNNSENGESRLRERAVNQGSAERINN